MLFFGHHLLDELVDPGDAQTGAAGVGVAIVVAHMVEVIAVVEDTDPHQA